MLMCVVDLFVANIILQIKSYLHFSYLIRDKTTFICHFQVFTNTFFMKFTFCYHDGVNDIPSQDSC